MESVTIPMAYRFEMREQLPEPKKKIYEEGFLTEALAFSREIASL